jgi:chromosome segregation ATPase
VLSLDREEERIWLLQNTQKEFQLMAVKVESAGISGAKAVAALQERLTAQRKQFDTVLKKLEQAELRREKEIRRLEKALSVKEQENTNLKTNLDAAVKMIAAVEKKLADSQNKHNILQQKNAVLTRENAALKKQNKTLEKKIKENTNTQAAPVRSAEIKEKQK